MTSSTDDILPVVVPTEMVAGSHWPGTSSRYNDVLSVTWAHFAEPYTTVYLTKKEVSEFEKLGIPFANKALENLRVRTKGLVWTHTKEVGGEMQFVALMHEDGLGPSRLLLKDELRSIFPKGFLFCVPERTCAFVFSKEASPAALEAVRDSVSGCFQKGREPVTERIFDEAEITDALLK